MEEARQRRIGPYRLETLLGRGGMGEVHKAWDERLERWVALKRLRRDSAATPEARSLFLREARAVARLTHPAIVQVFDVLENGDAWIVMELIAGPTLAELVRDGGPPDVGLVIEFGRQVASGLAAAHRSGIVHRDLKSENVMLAEQADPGLVKILDFGLAKRHAGVGESSSALSGRMVGTPRAMSPEQAQGLELDPRSDLFSFGVLLYELSTARSPFRAASPAATLERVIHHRPPPVRQFDHRLPRELSDVIDRLLAKDPAQRPQRAASVADALRRIAAEGLLHPVRPPAVPAPHRTDEGPSQRETLPSRVPLAEDAAIKTLLVWDLVGGDRSVLDDAQAAAGLGCHDRLAKDLLAAHGGREIGLTEARPALRGRKPGLLLFERPWNAVDYALKYHRALREVSAAASSPDRGRGAETAAGLAARIGIHVGEVILRRQTTTVAEGGTERPAAEGLVKPAVVRLTSLARGGQTLLTRSAFEAARREALATQAAELRWLEHGRYRFQEIDEEVEIFEVGVPGVAPFEAPASSSQVRRAATPSPHSVEGLGSGARSEVARRPMTVRSWPPPELPEEPYPVLLPYTHPALLAGREQELADLRRRLRMDVPILGLCAPSGAGKSSLLIGGLVPALRQDGKPVALIRHPHEAGLAGRVLGDLLEVDGERVKEEPWRGFVDRLLEVEQLSGETPILVLDQFEEVLRPRATPARAALGVLLAATARRRAGIGSPVCHWLLAYREEFHGDLVAWLQDVLRDVRDGDRGAGIDTLPHDLSSPERFECVPLPLLARVSRRAGNAMEDAVRVFQAAIEKPLGVEAADGRRHYRWRFAEGAAGRLAAAFAEARIANPEAPLTPELQVVLAHLLAQAGPEGVVDVPDDPGSLIVEALEDHLRRALETVFPSGLESQGKGFLSDPRVRRARALLALRELATATGQRTDGLGVEHLARMIGDDGEEILDRLATPLTRVVVLRKHLDGWRYVLAHDRMAEAVVHLVKVGGRLGELLVDGELLALRRFVTLKTTLYQSREEQGTRVPRQHYRRIGAHADALLRDDARRAWWAACRSRRRADHRRFVALATVALAFLLLVGWAAWSGTRWVRAPLVGKEQVVHGKPAVALAALHGLIAGNRVSSDELLALMRRRPATMDVLEYGLGEIPQDRLSAVVLEVVELALPRVAETPEDPVLIANLVWALDFAAARDRQYAAGAKAKGLRNRVLAPLRELRRPPPVPQDDPDWVEIAAGTFLMGSPEGDGERDQRPRHEVSVSGFRIQRHEVTNAEYRRLVPEHGGEGDLPVDRVSWYAAYTYAAWLGGRLPTEAEWELAARAGCAFTYCTQHGREAGVDDVAWTLRNSRHTGLPAASPVMRREPNPWGLYDMLGNLWEWTADWYASYPAGAVGDPWGPASPNDRGRGGRGGSFNARSSSARVENRSSSAPGTESPGVGFRVVLPSRCDHF